MRVLFYDRTPGRVTLHWIDVEESVATELVAGFLGGEPDDRIKYNGIRQLTRGTRMVQGYDDPRAVIPRFYNGRTIAGYRYTVINSAPRY